MTANEFPEFFSSPSPSVDQDSLFDQQISQIHFDQDSTCSSNIAKNEILYTPSPLTTPEVVVDRSDPALDPISENERSVDDSREGNEKVAKEIPDIISTFHSNQGPYGETFSQKDKGTREVTDINNIDSPEFRQIYPTAHEQHGSSKRSYDYCDVRPRPEAYKGMEAGTVLQPQDANCGTFGTRSEFCHPNTNPHTDFTFSHSGCDEPINPFDQAPEGTYNQMLCMDAAYQKRRLSMPFVKTCQSPPQKYPHEMRRFSAPHTSTENQRAIQYAMEARARRNSLSQTMMYSQMSQHWLQDWDRKMGLSKAHSRTMIKTAKSRKKLQKYNSL